MVNKYVTKPISIMDVLTPDTSVDDYVEEGVFFFSYANRPSGLPVGVNGNGWLIVLNSINRDYTKQIWISMGSSKTHDNRLPICMRGLFGESGYSDWSMLYSRSIEDILGGGNKCLSLSKKGGGLNDRRNGKRRGKRLKCMVRNVYDARRCVSVWPSKQLHHFSNACPDHGVTDKQPVVFADYKLERHIRYDSGVSLCVNGGDFTLSNGQTKRRVEQLDCDVTASRKGVVA